VVTLTYLRRNRVQVDLAETFGVSHSIIPPTVAALVDLVSGTTPDRGRRQTPVMPDRVGGWAVRTRSSGRAPTGRLHPWVGPLAVHMSGQSRTTVHGARVFGG